MIKWTTPNLKCTIPSEISFDYILMTLIQGDIVIEKKIENEDVKDGEFVVRFSQEETGQFSRSGNVEAQLNIVAGNTRMATNIVSLKITRNLHDEVIVNE